MSRPATIVSSTTIYAVLACTFLLRALIPVGYMPGNLLDGEFVRLCPAGVPALAVHAGHAGHHQGQGADESSADSQLIPVCPLGAALGQAGLPGQQPVTGVPATATRPAAPTTVDILPAPTGIAFRSRAPPAIPV